MFRKFTCLVGLHKWNVSRSYGRRKCRFCRKRQRRFAGTLLWRTIGRDFTNRKDGDL